MTVRAIGKENVMDRKRTGVPETARASVIDRRAVIIGGSAAAALLLPRGRAGWLASAQEAASDDTNKPFLVIRHYRLAPGAGVAEVVRRTEQDFVPILRQIAGFVEYYNVDLGNGEGATISVFSSQAGAEESTAQAATWVQANLADLFAGPPEVMQGNVVLNVMAEESGSVAAIS
jgi:hypothetical protein